MQQVRSFFVGNGIDVLIGPPVNETFMGNVVGLPQMVIPVAFNPVSSGSPRQQPSSVGIYALPNQDSKVIPQSCDCLAALHAVCVSCADSVAFAASQPVSFMHFI